MDNEEKRSISSGKDSNIANEITKDEMFVRMIITDSYLTMNECIHGFVSF